MASETELKTDSEIELDPVEVEKPDEKDADAESLERLKTALHDELSCLKTVSEKLDSIESKVSEWQTKILSQLQERLATANAEQMEKIQSSIRELSESMKQTEVAILPTPIQPAPEVESNSRESGNADAHPAQKTETPEPAQAQAPQRKKRRFL
jgi:uncharacterized phage infection (PIP) family protein YhgE